MKRLFILPTLLTYTFFNAQVGINTNNPKVTLDITKKLDRDSIDKNHFVGARAPRVTVKELASINNGTYNEEQIGAIVYVVDVSDKTSIAGQRVHIVVPGYYYFNGNIWLPFNMINVICEASVGKNFGPESIQEIDHLEKKGGSRIKFQNLIDTVKSSCTQPSCKYTIDIKGAGSWDKTQEGYVIPFDGIYSIQADVRIQDRIRWSNAATKAENIGFYMYAGPLSGKRIKEVWTVITPSSDTNKRQIVDYNTTIYLKKGQVVGIIAGHTSVNQETLGISDATLKVSLISTAQN